MLYNTLKFFVEDCRYKIRQYYYEFYFNYLYFMDYHFISLCVLTGALA